MNLFVNGHQYLPIHKKHGFIKIRARVRAEARTRETPKLRFFSHFSASSDQILVFLVFRACVLQRARAHGFLRNHIFHVRKGIGDHLQKESRRYLN